MACYVSAGHHLKDPGAVANGLQENHLTIRVRDRVILLLKQMGITVFQDDDKETLAEYLRRIKPGEASVVVEFHFDAAGAAATGTSAFYKDGASQNSKNFAIEMCKVGADTLTIKNRGASSESDSHRGVLGLTHEPGITALVEVCFISNLEDLTKFGAHFDNLCVAYARVIKKYDDFIK